MIKPIAVLGCGASVDVEFAPLIERHNWSLDKYGYVVASIGGARVKLHNLVLGPTPPGKTADHKDRNKLNNTLENLRFVHYSEQNFNQGKRPSNTGVRGVRRTVHGTFIAQIYRDRKRVKKSFKTLDEATEWRQRMEQELYEGIFS